MQENELVTNSLKKETGLLRCVKLHHVVEDNYTVCMRANEEDFVCVCLYARMLASDNKF